MYNVLTYPSCTNLPFTCLESNTLIVLQWLALLEDQTINKRAVKDSSTAKLTCPYCESPFESKQALSTHIDRLHTVTGVLEVDVRRMFE
jgi:hypothetical protein